MAQCKGNCPNCEIITDDRDRLYCATYQTMQQMVSLKKELTELKKEVKVFKNIEESSPEIIETDKSVQ